MALADKKNVYSQLDKMQKRELKDLLDYFDGGLWLTEPSKILFGVKWYHSELDTIINGR